MSLHRKPTTPELAAADTRCELNLRRSGAFVPRLSLTEATVRFQTRRRSRMSYDLMVFAAEAAPKDRAAFLEWYEGHAEWVEGGGRPFL